MRLLTALACVALMSCIATAQTDMDTCLLSKEQAAKAKWSPLKEKCDPSITLEERCTSCLCGFREVLAPLMAESGVSVNVSDVDQSQATSAVMACYDIVVPELEKAGVDLGALVELMGCAKLPECLTTAK